ncbi:hypothetical protein FNU79_16185 [Deinococcus detaillensis]|uniref:DUF2304 domain-containing protein n=1 Tax=Deinococcus detaillensis TaxID=2592048 RepID=A0A553UL43_9DEIO|nr:hypothetical protein [Deinococcus detaillensis]TSA80781.1 hypothetical protein FNU79_16185 [Deinococcus detaillensis]
MSPALLSVLFLIVQGVVLGWASVLILVQFPGKSARLPLASVVAYYSACYFWPPPSARALRNGDAYLLADAVRYGLLVLSFALCVLLLVRIIQQRERRIRVLSEEVESLRAEAT